MSAPAWALMILVICACAAAEPARAQEDPRGTESPYGVLSFLAWDHDWNAYHYGGDRVDRALRLMKEAGVRIVRIDFLWADLEPAEGRWDFSRTDRLVERCERHGIKILAMLHYNNPSWAAARWNEPPDPPKFARFASAVVSRYKDRIRYWEVWNEPDHTDYWTPQDGSLRAYSRLLRETSIAIRRADPTATVVLGGLAHPQASLRKIYANGSGEYFDVVNVHPFVDPLGPGPLERLKSIWRDVRKILEEHGDLDKEIWFTELGCPGVPEGVETKDWWLGTNPDPELQAWWVGQVYGEPLEWPGVKKVFWAFFRDTRENFRSGVDYFGLVDADLKPKPAYEAYRRAALREPGRPPKGGS